MREVGDDMYRWVNGYVGRWGSDVCRWIGGWWCGWWVYGEVELNFVSIPVQPAVFQTWSLSDG